MKYEVVISEEAENDLRMIYEYIAISLLSPINAAGQLSRIEKQILSLDESPHKFPRYKREPWKSRGLRFVPVDNYLIFYIPDDDHAKVTVTRVMYGGRDITGILNQ